MCGICGICATDPQARIDPAVVEALAATLAHRGPDGKGLHVNGRVALGHRRLSIIDLAHGAQPMFSADGTVAIVFNGEIYNYVELRQELIASGRRLRTDSDTEVIIHLYEQRQEECLHALNGMFAFALWDQNNGRLFAARDRLGEKPLYYFVKDGRLAFASELKAFARYPGFEPRICLESLDHYLAYGYIPAPWTIFEGVHKLPAAHALIWENGRLRTYRYWRTEVSPTGRLDEVEYVRELRRRLDESIRIRLRSDVPLGAFLSGGIDSSAIVALASLQMDRPLETFSVGFAFQDFDESPFARIVAKRYRTRHHELRVDDLDISIFPELVAYFDEPFADPSAVPTYYVAREARRFVKVCLSGDAGDELFAGYDQYANCRKRRWMDMVPAGLRGPVLRSAARLWPDAMKGAGWLRRMSVSGAERYQREMGIFDARQRRDLLQPDALAHARLEPWLFADYFHANGRDPVATRQFADQMTYLPEDILVKVDRTAMKNSLEVRVPFLDHTVVEWVNAMPTDMKLRGNRRKYVLKQVLRDLLPAEVLDRGKRGFGMPIKHWFRGDLDGFARDLLLSPSNRSQRFFRPDAVRRLLDGHQRGLRDLSRRVWAVLWFEQWCRTFGI